jgi:hypothetical protein
MINYVTCGTFALELDYLHSVEVAMVLVTMAIDITKACDLCNLCIWTLISKKKEKKNYAHRWYRHECEPVVQMLNTLDRVVA